MVGDSSFQFKNLLPYFERSVHFTAPSSLRVANATPSYDAAVLSTTGGPPQVSFPNWANAISSWFALSLIQLGLRSTIGFTNGTLFGWSYVANTLDPKSETRSSSETSFLRESLTKTTNLALYQSILAKQVMFDGQNQSAFLSTVKVLDTQLLLIRRL